MKDAQSPHISSHLKNKLVRRGSCGGRGQKIISYKSDQLLRSATSPPGFVRRLKDGEERKLEWLVSKQRLIERR
jgi:hypothetical protein